MKLTTQQETEIINAYKSVWVANLSANMKDFSSYLVDDFSIIGSAKGETFFSKEDAVAFYSATADELKDKADLRNRDIRIQAIEENMVIVHELSDIYVLIETEWTFYGHARISCVMKNIADAWKAIHQHVSFADHRTEEGQQLAAQKIEQENLELKEAVQRRTVELEVKNRELQIEAAVERVRTKALAMFKSEEILDVVVKLKEEMMGLDIPNVIAATIYLEEKDGSIRIRDLTSIEVLNGKYHQPLDIIFNMEESHPDFFMRKVWNNDAKYFVVIQDEDDLQTTIQWLRDNNREEQAVETEEFIKAGHLKKVYHPTVPLNKGRMCIDLLEPPSEEVESIMTKMAAAFNLAHKRFEDLKNSEKQITEAQVELALERVRARTMAMQHSDELADASFVLDTQVRSLGIQTRGCAFNIYGEDESTEWFSSEHGILPPYKTPKEDFFLRAYNAGQSGKQIFIEEFAGEDCKAHYEYLQTIPIMGDALRAMIDAGLSFPERQIDHATFFKYGYLLFITLEPVPDAHEVFIRFAKVFEQTYTRFLDLQKAEEQAKKASQDVIEIKEARKKAEDTLVELQATQKQLIQSEKMASLGELTAGIAHEIQNPLNFVNNFSEINKEMVDEVVEEIDKGNYDEAKDILKDVKENSEKINHHGKRADAIVKGMLQHSRKSEGQKEPTDINVLCDEYLRLAYHGLRAKDKSFNVTLNTEFDESIDKINIVPQDIGRVVLNLITNAFYAVNEKQKIAGSDYQPVVELKTLSINREINIVVRDNGSGIPQNIIDKIFQPFFTTKPTGQGTGLGLSLAYDIVKAHSGYLKVNSTGGKGTEFIIELPLVYL